MAARRRRQVETDREERRKEESRAHRASVQARGREWCARLRSARPPQRTADARARRAMWCWNTPTGSTGYQRTGPVRWHAAACLPVCKTSPKDEHFTKTSECEGSTNASSMLKFTGCYLHCPYSYSREISVQLYILSYALNIILYNIQRTYVTFNGL